MLPTQSLCNVHHFGLGKPLRKSKCRQNCLGCLHAWSQHETVFWFPVASVAPWLRNPAVFTILRLHTARQKAVEQVQSRQHSTTLPVQPSTAGLQPFHAAVGSCCGNLLRGTQVGEVQKYTVSVLNLWWRSHFTTSSALMSPMGRRQ